MNSENDEDKEGVVSEEGVPAQEDIPAPEEKEEPLDFTLELETRPVTFRMKDGTEHKMKLQELDGEGRDKYISLMSSKVQFSAQTGKPVGLKNYTGVDIELLHMCLIDSSGCKVSKVFIGKIPGKFMDKLAKAAMKLSGLEPEKEAVKAAKND